jgi:predicted nucleic acid-binding Zn ribbon protein
MPLYQGTCPEHGKFERLLPQLGHPPARVRCTQCNRNVPRIPSSGSFILKGAGFYRPSPKGEDK